MKGGDYILKKGDVFMILGILLSGLGMIASHESDKAELKETVKEEVDRQLHPEKEKEEEP